jgi:hypothetical protein
MIELKATEKAGSIALEKALFLLDAIFWWRIPYQISISWRKLCKMKGSKIN